MGEGSPLDWDKNIVITVVFITVVTRVAEGRKGIFSTTAFLVLKPFKTSENGS